MLKQIEKGRSAVATLVRVHVDTQKTQKGRGHRWERLLLVVQESENKASRFAARVTL